jgi:alpha-galactosidase
VVSLLLLALCLAGCQQGPQKDATMAVMEPAVVIANSSIVLELDATMHFRLRPPQGATTVIDGWAELESAGTVLAFALEPASVSRTPVTTSLGLAQRLTVWGVADLPGGGRLRRTVTVDAYRQWPQAFIVQARYENLSAGPLTLDRLADPVLLLDSSRSDPGQQPYQFWSFQGAAVQWGQDLAFPLNSAFSRDNFLGAVDGGEGGGIPLVYLWNRQLGVALAHVAPAPQQWSMPVQADARHGVRMALAEEGPLAVPAGGAVEGLPTLLSLHRGDFFAPLALYAEVLAAQGLSPAQLSAEDYAVPWCSWGYELDVQPAEVLGILPKLREMGIHWVTLDDRWFDTYGDWNPRPDTFPGGAVQMHELVDTIHAAGFYAQLWWYPLAVEDGVGAYESHRYGVAQVLQEHPDWLCHNADGSVARNNRGLAILDPAIPGVQQYMVDLTRRFVLDWGFDGHKLDNIYAVPPCYDSPYHARPEDSAAAMADIYRLIHETTRHLKPESVTQLCPCGTSPSFIVLPYYDQAVTADPTSSAQVRQRVKFYKALLGPRAAVSADHVELSDGGRDFASAIGTGAIPATKFVWPEDEAVRGRVKEWQGLDAEREAWWKQWLLLYDRYRLSEGEYLNLYDVAYDVPEGHAIRKGEQLYYAFYTAQAGGGYRGSVELRGLEPRAYRLVGYVDGQELGTAQGPTATLQVDFRGSLLIEATPLEEP